MSVKKESVMRGKSWQLQSVRCVKLSGHFNYKFKTIREEAF